ncbi:MAG: hypothetical protein N3A71_02965 [Candidatus Dojkabacteria bacterium]|nr:hypothetical protein [Candidatus Dojkabacteria bacterium]
MTISLISTFVIVSFLAIFYLIVRDLLKRYKPDIFNRIFHIRFDTILAFLITILISISTNMKISELSDKTMLILNEEILFAILSFCMAFLSFGIGVKFIIETIKKYINIDKLLAFHNSFLIYQNFASIWIYSSFLTLLVIVSYLEIQQSYEPISIELFLFFLISFIINTILIKQIINGQSANTKLQRLYVFFDLTTVLLLSSMIFYNADRTNFFFYYPLTISTLVGLITGIIYNFLEEKVNKKFNKI